MFDNNYILEVRHFSIAQRVLKLIKFNKKLFYVLFLICDQIQKIRDTGVNN